MSSVASSQGHLQLGSGKWTARSTSSSTYCIQYCTSQPRLLEGFLKWNFSLFLVSKEERPVLRNLSLWALWQSAPAGGLTYLDSHVSTALTHIEEIKSFLWYCVG